MIGIRSRVNHGNHGAAADKVDAMMAADKVDGGASEAAALGESTAEAGTNEAKLGALRKQEEETGSTIGIRKEKRELKDEIRRLNRLKRLGLGAPSGDGDE